MKSIQLASLIANLTTDGHIQLNKKNGVISFYAKEISEINKFNSKCNYLFGIAGKIFRDERNNNIRYKLFLSNKKIATFLKQKGAPTGNKTNGCFEIPNWISKGSKNIKIAYLQSIFDGEGSIFKCKDGRWRLTLTFHKDEKIVQNGINYLNKVRLLLNEFKIQTSGVWLSEGKLRKDKTRSKNLKIEIKKKSFNYFFNRVNFSNKIKRFKLKKAITETYKN